MAERPRALERDMVRDLEILTAIGEGRPLSQRALAQRPLRREHVELEPGRLLVGEAQREHGDL